MEEYVTLNSCVDVLLDFVGGLGTVRRLIDVISNWVVDFGSFVRTGGRGELMWTIAAPQGGSGHVPSDFAFDDDDDAFFPNGLVDAGMDVENA